VPITCRSFISANFFWLTLPAALWLTCCSHTLSLEQPGNEDYIPASLESGGVVTIETPLKAGDNIEIFVTEDPSFNGSYTIRKEGHIIFPTFGRFHLAGLSPRHAEAKLRDELQRGKLRTATVILDRVIEVLPPGQENKDRLLVYLTGKVAQPGQHSLTVEKGKALGIYDSIMISGGFTRFAEPKKAYVIRSAKSGGGKRRIALDLQAVAEGQQPDMPVHPGDVVVVPEKVFGF